MSISGQRLPLGEFSSSKINKLSLPVGNVFKPTTSLPSIRSLMNQEEETDNNHNEIRVHIPNSNNIMRLQSETIHNGRDYSEISKKLQVRLQFAYYKYKTKQSHLRFSDLKEKYSIDASKDKNKISNNRRISLKRRKLVVSHGNYRTPAKSTKHRHLNTSTIINGLQTDDNDENSSTRTSNSDFTSTNNTSTNATTITNNTSMMLNNTTPTRNSQKLRLRQETPMSVKAAKSLIHLFTSNNQL